MQNLHALIIDDNAVDAAILRSLLSRMDVSFDVVADSRRIGEILPTISSPSVIFLDLEMPGTNGYEVLAAINDDPTFASVPVVAYTSNSAEMPQARAAGFHSFLGKPLRGSEFAGQFERIIGGEPVWEVR